MTKYNKYFKDYTNTINIFCFNQSPQIYSKIYNSFFNMLLNNIYFESTDIFRDNVIDLYTVNSFLPKTGLTRTNFNFLKKTNNSLFVLSKVTLDPKHANLFNVNSAEVLPA